MHLAHHDMTWAGWWKKNNTPFDLDLVLREIKLAGYEGVELGGDEAKLGKPQELLRRLSNHGLRLAAFNTRVTANPWPPNTAEYRASMDFAAALNVKTIMVCGGFFNFGRRTIFESDYKLFAENLASAHAYAAQYGQKITYHPHLGCMVETAREAAILLNFIPELQFCVDTGHFIAAGTDSAQFIRDYGNKIGHIHLKDWEPEAQHFTELGDGRAGLNFAAIFDALERIEYTGWVTVERDNPQIPPLDSARKSRKFLSEFGLCPISA